MTIDYFTVITIAAPQGSTEMRATVTAVYSVPETSTAEELYFLAFNHAEEQMGVPKGTANVLFYSKEKNSSSA